MHLAVGARGWRRALPDAAARARRAVHAALVSAGAAAPLEVAVLLGDDLALRRLNAKFRGQDRPTNVLAFPDGADGRAGDLALALETCVAEAAAQGKSLGDHLSHLVVHGTLHLLGHDHAGAAPARRMEALERRILEGLGIGDPYRMALAR